MVKMEEIARASDAISGAVGSELPAIALQLGSGLNSVAEAVEKPVVLPYSDIPHFPEPSVEGHEGRMLIGALSGTPVICLQGRVHYYEGRGLDPVVFMVRTLRSLGVDTLLLTNAAGSLDRDMPPGSLMVIRDHINLSGANPLIGPNEDSVGPRFPDMTDAYDPALRKLIRQTARDLDSQIHEGVYVMASGPNFETPAEIEAFRRLGANAVGMSTVPECISARHAGMRVAGISTITNLAAGLSEVPLTHEETMLEGAAASARLSELLTAVVGHLAP